MHIQLRSYLTQEILFEYDTPDNTPDKTIARAIGSGIDMNDVDLRFYDLDLHASDLAECSLRPIRHDLFGVLLHARSEVTALLDAFYNGDVDGSLYDGECCCLVGTACKARNVDPMGKNIGIPKDTDSPIEQWLLEVKPGDTPDNSLVVAITVEWIHQFRRLTA